MNNNNDQALDDEKPKKVINELEGLSEFLDSEDSSSNIPELDQSIPTLTESIPVLDQEIPELTTEVHIPDSFKISFDAENSTETVEQQMIRTHHENKATPPELIDVIETIELIDVPEPLVEKELESLVSQQDQETTNINFTLVESSPEQLSNKSLLEQQYELEQSAKQQRSLLPETNVPETNVADAGAVETEPPEIVTTEIEAGTSEQELISAEEVLENAWVKVEMLLMNNLPTQVSGAFLELLNEKFDDNRAHLLDELCRLDEQALAELSDELDDLDQGF